MQFIPQQRISPHTPRYAPYLSPMSAPSPVYFAGHPAVPSQTLFLRKPKPLPTFLCSYEGCDAAFARDEHLTRHERTHSQEKPFHCNLGGCEKWFSRLDNVRQHIKSQHANYMATGQADTLMRELSALQKQLSAQATARRRARRQESNESLASMGGQRRSPGESPQSPEHAHQSSSASSGSSVKTPGRDSPSPPHHPPHLRMRSAPAYLSMPNGSNYGASTPFQMTPTGNYYSRPLLMSTGSEDNVAGMVKGTWTPPPIPTQGTFMPLHRKASLPSVIGLPQHAHHQISNAPHTSMGPPALHYQHQQQQQVAQQSYTFDDFGRSLVSPTSAFFNMAMSGAPSSSFGSAPSGSDQFGYNATESAASFSTAQTPMNILAAQQAEARSRPSSGAMADYGLASTAGGPVPSGMVGDMMDISAPPTAVSEGARNSEMTTHGTDHHSASAQMGVQVNGAPWSSSPSAPALPQLQRVNLTSPMLAQSPRISSPSNASPRRFESLAAALSGQSSE